jgi:hypothetical protein
LIWVYEPGSTEVTDGVWVANSFTFPSTPSNYNFTLELYNNDDLVESSTSWIHICADYIDADAASFVVEPFKDIAKETLFKANIKIGTLKVPQGYDNGVSDFYTNLILEFDWEAADKSYDDDLGFTDLEDYDEVPCAPTTYSTSVWPAFV